MINKLIEGIFYIITKIFDLIFTPFFNALFALFPALSTYLTYITSFLSRALSYVQFFTYSLFFPSGYMTAIFNYFIIKFSIFILSRSIKFIINVYNKLKP